MDVVWLKRDIRLTDHGPLSAALHHCPVGREVLVLYLYEPSQLAQPTVHGSHIAFMNEGLLELDSKLTDLIDNESAKTSQNLLEKKKTQANDSRVEPIGELVTSAHGFQSITVCYCSVVDCLKNIHATRPIGRLLSHEETGHWASFQRDKEVRRWCRQSRIPFKEYLQSGATRALRNRDDFSKHLTKFMNQPQHPVPVSFHGRLVADLNLPGRVRVPLLNEIHEIPVEYRVDRPHRQKGGESLALTTLRSFLSDRGAHFSTGISSPNSSWSTCSRLSPFLTWGNVSLRHVVQSVKQRQAEIKVLRSQRFLDKSPWPRSLSAFLSRLHWRSHFIQKLESEPEMEKRDLCQAYQHLRRQPGDWNERYYHCWSTGTTGFPFVDACMRCLLAHGWINFRMRAMLVSFATYNLWLDWKRIAPHLARVFLDYEPGIHYPQLQMQSGTTGINAMRVYSVVKQGKDQDAKGKFVRKYVPELKNIPDDYIHEPWRMPKAVQSKAKVTIGVEYPFPIVDEKESAKVAKAKVATIRRQEATKQEATKVYAKHGSRTANRDRPAAKRAREGDRPQQRTLHDVVKTAEMMASKPTIAAPELTGSCLPVAGWACAACTFINDKPVALACSVCGTFRYSTER